MPKQDQTLGTSGTGCTNITHILLLRYCTPGKPADHNLAVINQIHVGVILRIWRPKPTAGPDKDLNMTQMVGDVLQLQPSKDVMQVTEASLVFWQFQGGVRAYCGRDGESKDSEKHASQRGQ